MAARARRRSSKGHAEPLEKLRALTGQVKTPAPRIAGRRPKSREAPAPRPQPAPTSPAASAPPGGTTHPDLAFLRNMVGDDGAELPGLVKRDCADCGGTFMLAPAEIRCPDCADRHALRAGMARASSKPKAR